MVFWLQLLGTRIIRNDTLNEKPQGKTLLNVRGLFVITVPMLIKLPVGLMAQLVEHCRGQGSSPVEAWIFQAFLSLLLRVHSKTSKITNIKKLFPFAVQMKFH